MTTVDFARLRIAAALNEIDRLIQSEFPSQSSKDAMSILQDRCSRFMVSFEDITIESSHYGREVILNRCEASLEWLFTYLPILGFILRSTNVRNGFEAYGPLLRLAQSLMGQDIKLIVSSEWQLTPHTYYPVTELPGFILIGLPSTESSNPLMIPLSGHEIGHAVWHLKRLNDKYNSQIRESILREIRDKEWKRYEELYPNIEKTELDGSWIGESTWTPAIQWALHQMEEMFCDLIGICLFAESYLYAFMYLIAPGTRHRSLRYPNMKDRVRYLVSAASDFGVEIPTDFAQSFNPDKEDNFDQRIKFLLSMADNAAALNEADILQMVMEFTSNSSTPERDDARVNHIVDEFKKFVVPTADPEAVVNIMCAGWKCSNDCDLWEHIPQIEPKDWERVLRDIIYKSLEVSEIHERLENARLLRERGEST